MSLTEDVMERDTRTRREPARAEWMILGLALVLPTVATWVYFILLGGQPAMQAAYTVTKVLQFGLPVIWVWAVRREALRMGLGSVRGVGAGLGFGLLVMAGAFAIYYGWLKGSPAFGNMQGELEDKVRGMGALSPLRFVVLGAFISIIHSFLEEYYWRWFVFGRLRKLIPLGAAVAISSLGFMAHHVLVIGTYVGLAHWPVVAFLSLSVAVGGAFWAWLYHRTGSLISPWLSHLLVDVALMMVGYDQLWGLG